jgi:hypothetical protein
VVHMYLNMFDFTESSVSPATHSAIRVARTSALHCNSLPVLELQTRGSALATMVLEASHHLRVELSEREFLRRRRRCSVA